MTFIHLIALAIIQGVTEFLPVSSSAHLILVPQFLNVDDQGMMIDVAAHGGSLLAVILYFYREALQIFRGFFDTILMRASDARQFFFLIAVATFPGLVIGGFLHFYASDLFRHIEIIAATSLGFGVLLWWVDKKMPTAKGLDGLTFKSTFMIGCAQILAFIPGTSRSGITMTMARGLGFDRDASARFSMFLSIPIIGAAVGVYLIKMITSGAPLNVGADFFMVMGLSFVVSIISIHWLLKFIRSHSFAIFAIYRILLSGVILLLFL